MPLKKAEKAKYTLCIFHGGNEKCLHPNKPNGYQPQCQNHLYCYGRRLLSWQGVLSLQCEIGSLLFSGCWKHLENSYNPPPSPLRTKRHQPNPKSFILVPNPELVLIHVTPVLLDNIDLCTLFISIYHRSLPQMTPDNLLLPLLNFQVCPWSWTLRSLRRSAPWFLRPQIHSLLSFPSFVNWTSIWC